MTAETTAPGWSDSMERALLWADAAAALRGAAQPVTETELLLGALLAHPGSKGEMRSLLRRFGLTARDVLPDSFPPVSADALKHAAAIQRPSPPTRDATAESVLLAASRSTTRRGSDSCAVSSCAPLPLPSSPARAPAPRSLLVPARSKQWL